MPNLDQHSFSIRQNILRMITQAGTGHPAGSLGMTDVLVTLYFKVLNHRPDNPNWNQRDYLLLSNGHICPALYATLAQSGYFDPQELMTLRQLGSRLQGHPHFEKKDSIEDFSKNLPGIENTSGPLGQGLSQAAGLALGLKMDNKPNHVYCLTSDGEHNEGQTWEALMFAANNQLDNLTMIVDRNQIQLSGNTRQIMPLEPLARKLKAFRWRVIEVDGHNFDKIETACRHAHQTKNRPTAIICQTTPGKGVNFMEEDYRWHGKAPNSKELQQALQELEKNYRK